MMNKFTIHLDELSGEIEGFSPQEVGAYFLLLAQCARVGYLPVEDAQLARIARMRPTSWMKIRDRVLSPFEKNLEKSENISKKSLQKQAQKMAEKSQIARANAQQRLSGRSADAQRTLKTKKSFQKVTQKTAENSHSASADAQRTLNGREQISTSTLYTTNTSYLEDRDISLEVSVSRVGQTSNLTPSSHLRLVTSDLGSDHARVEPEPQTQAPSPEAAPALEVEPRTTASTPPADQTTPRRARQASGARGTRWPADAVVPDDWREAAVAVRSQHGLGAINVDLVATRFANYWASASGAKATKTDWKRTWINWATNERGSGHGQQGQGNGRTGRRRMLDELMEIRAQRIAAETAGDAGGGFCD